MSVNIHYRGKINDKKTVNKLIAEVREIAEVNGWKHASRDEDWDLPPNAHLESAKGPGIKIVGHCALKGIHFQPIKDCEAVWLYFNSNGFLSTPFRVALDAEEGYPSQKIWISTKTQFAGVDTHIAIIKILRYLKKKYIPDLEVRDEGGYWKEMDRDLLEKRMEQVNLTINRLNNRIKLKPQNRKM